MISSHPSLTLLLAWSDSVYWPNGSPKIWLPGGILYTQVNIVEPDHINQHKQGKQIFPSVSTRGDTVSAHGDSVSAMDRTVQVLGDSECSWCDNSVSDSVSAHGNSLHIIILYSTHICDGWVGVPQ